MLHEEEKISTLLLSIFDIFEQMKPIYVDLCLQPIREHMLPSCAVRNTVHASMF